MKPNKLGTQPISISTRSTAIRCVLFFAVIVVRCLLLSHLSSHEEYSLTPDSPLYLALANAIVDGDDDLEVEDDGRRPPGYPLFCAAIIRVWGTSWFPILIVQHLVLLFSAGLVWLVPWGGVTARTREVAAWLLLLDPISLIYASYVMSETLFAVSVLIAWMSCDWFLRRRDRLTAGIAGMLVGVTVLIRPVTLFLPVFLFACLLCCRHLRNWQNLGLATVFLVTSAVPILGLIEFNHQKYGARFVSSISSTNLLYYRAAGAIAEDDGLTRSTVADQLRVDFEARYGQQTDLGSKHRLQSREAIKLLLEHPRGAVVSTMKGTLRMLFGPAWKAGSRLIYGQEPYNQPASTPLFVRALQVASSVGMVILAAVGLILAVRGGTYTPVSLHLAVWLIYFLIICSGSEAHARFRVPIVPLMSMMAGLGLACMGSSRRNGQPDGECSAA